MKTTILRILSSISDVLVRLEYIVDDLIDRVNGTHINYPTRCEIIDVTGVEVFPDVMGNTPDISKPHVGEFGLAEKIDDLTVKITLDSGVVLMGYECWWRPIRDNVEKK